MGKEGRKGCIFFAVWYWASEAGLGTMWCGARKEGSVHTPQGNVEGIRNLIAIRIHEYFHSFISSCLLCTGGSPRSSPCLEAVYDYWGGRNQSITSKIPRNRIHYVPNKQAINQAFNSENRQEQLLVDEKKEKEKRTRGVRISDLSAFLLYSHSLIPRYPVILSPEISRESSQILSFVISRSSLFC